MKTVLGMIGLLAACGATTAFGSLNAHSGDATAVAQAARRTKHSLADGIRQLSTEPETAISAKFEFDGEGDLSLSVYTAERGLSVDAEHNVLKEYAGAPDQGTWAPKVEVFKDFAHIARSAQQKTLMALSDFSLVEILAKAEKETNGRALSITPVLAGHDAHFLVTVAVGEKVVEAKYVLFRDEDHDANDDGGSGKH
jgi:hypothetical protein